MQAAHTAPKWLGIDLATSRWIFPLVGLLTTTIVGSGYAFSVFIRPLEAEFAWTRAETIIAFSVAMWLFGAVTWPGGYFIDKYGPRIPYLVGGVFLAAGMMASSRITGVGGLVLTFGIINGAGLGLTYGASTLALNARWFPDARRPLAIGLSLAGMGLGPMLAAPIWAWAIGVAGWRVTYFVSGVIFLVVLGILSTIVRFPPRSIEFDRNNARWVPVPAERLAKEPAGPDRPAVDPEDLTFGEAVRNPYLWLTGLIFFTTIFGGLMAVGQLAAYAQDAPPAGVGLSAGLAAAAIMAFGVCNAVGRPLAGMLTSRIGIKWAYVTATSLMVLAMLTLVVARGMLTLSIAAVMTGLAFGGTLALSPILSTALFGASFIARIYGFIYLLGFGFGGMFGPLAGGMMRDATGAYIWSFLTAAIVAAVSLLILIIFIPGRGQERQSRRPAQVLESTREEAAALTHLN
jgi:OFA family oxalate/formate antiporter-like MFS transporter